MHLLAEETTTTASDAFRDTSVAVLPTGSVEQHGPALPLGTDFLAAETVARTVDRDDTVVLPTVPVGVSDHHRQFSGTLWTDPTTFENYVADIAASIASHGVKKVVVVNGHGGNVDALSRAARRLRADEVAFVAPWNWWSNLDDLTKELFGTPGIGHADAIETSMVYAIDDELVREGALEAAEAGASESWGRSVHGAEIGFDTADFSESGAVGEPTKGSKEAGDRLLEQAASELDSLLDWLAAQPFSDLLPEDHR
ncbi:creatininase [Haloprofundus marisrubri]|uniref:Creatininase n=1 Tax=Haloprofundus marisrubri TaxID=1514971 RepID=A0A0W1R9B9_9EURY|nr:creatininase family protein [Haloprofundus marisrubri]KTG09701.1 creatininase [Haloprofundus marisrubri]